MHPSTNTIMKINIAGDNELTTFSTGSASALETMMLYQMTKSLDKVLPEEAKSENIFQKWNRSRKTLQAMQKLMSRNSFYAEETIQRFALFQYVRVVFRWVRLSRHYSRLQLTVQFQH